MPVAFQVIIGKLFLRPAQTCCCTCAHLFRPLQLKSCFPPIISGMPRQTKAPGTSYSALILIDYSDIPYITVTVALVLCSRTAVVRPPRVPVPE